MTTPDPSVLNSAPRQREMLSILSIFFHVFVQHSISIHMLKEKKMACTFLGFGPASISYRASAISYPLSLGSKPCNIIKSYVGEITPQILKRK